MASTRSHEGCREIGGAREAHRDDAATTLDLADVSGLHDLPDVSGLLARLLDERIPLALIADLANPGGPDSDAIMASEARSVG